MVIGIVGYGPLRWVRNGAQSPKTENRQPKTENQWKTLKQQKNKRTIKRTIKHKKTKKPKQILESNLMNISNYFKYFFDFVEFALRICFLFLLTTPAATPATPLLWSRKWLILDGPGRILGALGAFWTIIVDSRWFSLIFVDFRGFSLMFIDFHWF